MPRHSDDPVRHIITFRVNGEEKIALERLAEESGCSLSNYVRRKFQVIRETEYLKSEVAS